MLTETWCGVEGCKGPQPGVGYRDPNKDYTAEYWDDYLAEFGPGAYIEARYLQEEAPPCAP